MSLVSLVTVAAGSFVALAGIGWLFGPPKKQVKMRMGMDGMGMGNGGEIVEMDHMGRGLTELGDDEGQMPGAGGLSPADQQQLKLLFQICISQARQMLSSGRANEAKELAMKGLQFASYFGQNSIEFGSAMTMLASSLESLGAVEKAQEFYSKSFYIFEKLQDYDSSYTLCSAIIRAIQASPHKTKIADKKDAAKVTQHYQEIATWAEKAANICINFMEAPNTEKAEALARVAMAWSNAGKFNKAESYFSQALKLHSPKESLRDLWDCMDLFTNCLLHQRKVEQAVVELRNFREQLQKQINEQQQEPGLQEPSQAATEAHYIIAQVMTRIAEIYFSEDRFAECDDELFEQVQFCVKNKM